jgi:hypothetical protein
VATIINDVEINDPVPDGLINGWRGKLLILGGGKCVWDDYLEAREIFGGKGEYRIMCVNDIGAQFKAEPIQHAVSLHRRNLPAIRLMRKEKSMLEHVITHCHKPGPEVQCVWPIANVGGTSGMFAVKIALAMGFEKIIICGVPVDGSGHYFDPLNVNDNDSTTFTGSAQIAEWREMASRKIAGARVRSMSGRSQAAFGKPTKEWASGNN